MAQPAPTARQCTAVLTGVMIRNEVPHTDSLIADLTAVIVSREAALLEYLAARARTRVEQVLAHSVRAEAFRRYSPPRRGRHHGHPTARRSADRVRENKPDAARCRNAIGSRG
jgi:hypothetical protein